MGGLRLHRNITPQLLPIVTFEPTIGIVAGRIDKLGVDIRSFREPLTRAIKEVMIPSFRKNFDQGGRPESWPPLSEATLEIRQRRGVGGSDPLIRTGLLRRTMGQQNIWTIKKESAILKDLPAKVWYGAIHQAGYEGRSMKALIKKTGSPRAALESIINQQLDVMERGIQFRASRGRELRYEGGGGTIRTGAAEIPARPFVMYQDEDEDAIMEIFIKWLGERVDRAFRGM